MGLYDIENLQFELDNLTQRSDTLDVVISEATEEQAKAAARIVEINGIIAYLQSGDDPPTKLADITGFLAESKHALTADYLKLSWDVVAHADNYILLGSVNPDFAVTYETYAGPLLTKDVVYLDPEQTIQLQPGNTYYFKLVAKGAGYADSDPVTTSALLMAKLAAPTSFNLATLAGVNSGTWDADEDTGINYKVHRSETADVEDGAFLQDAYTASFGDSTGVAGVEYWYFVKAVKSLSQDSDFVNDNIVTSV